MMIILIAISIIQVFKFYIGVRATGLGWISDELFFLFFFIGRLKCRTRVDRTLLIEHTIQFHPL